MNPRPTIPLIPTEFDLRVRLHGANNNRLPFDGWGPHLPMSGLR